MAFSFESKHSNFFSFHRREQKYTNSYESEIRNVNIFYVGYKLTLLMMVSLFPSDLPNGRFYPF